MEETGFFHINGQIKLGNGTDRRKPLSGTRTLPWATRTLPLKRSCFHWIWKNGGACKKSRIEDHQLNTYQEVILAHVSIVSKTVLAAIFVKSA